VQAILKGKKGEKPPYMPAFETKGITEDDAKALAAYMKSLRTPAN
jgi:cytochrome c1